VLLQKPGTGHRHYGFSGSRFLEWSGVVLESDRHPDTCAFRSRIGNSPALGKLDPEGLGVEFHQPGSDEHPEELVPFAGSQPHILSVELGEGKTPVAKQGDYDSPVSKVLDPQDFYLGIGR
jgi:hypothetical protein